MAHPIIPYLSDLAKRHIMSKNLVKKQFAKEIGVPYTIFYRLTLGDQKGISFLHSKKILRAIEPEQYLTILGKYFPEETEDLLSKNPEIEDSSEEFAEMADFAFSDFDTYRVYSVAAEAKGANRNEVVHESGQPGLKILEELLERKIIEEKSDGTFKSNISDVNFWDKDLLMTVGQHNIQLFGKSNPASHMRNWVEGLNDQGVRRYYDAHIKFLESLKEIESDPSLKGSHVMCSTVLVCPVNSQKK